jgi:hypothetical protein
MDDIVVVKVVMPMVIWRKLFEARTELEAHLLSKRGGLFTFHLMVRGELKAKQW